MDKSIIITESIILKRFDEMCKESLSPDIYSIWADQIIPQLNQLRQSLLVKVVNVSLTDVEIKLIIQSLNLWIENSPNNIWKNEITKLTNKLKVCEKEFCELKESIL